MATGREMIRFGGSIRNKDRPLDQRQEAKAVVMSTPLRSNSTPPLPSRLQNAVETPRIQEPQELGFLSLLGGWVEV